MEQLAYRRSMLQHCLFMAATDPEYAQWAADWYEVNEPWSLAGLGAKVQAAIEKRTRAQEGGK